MAILRARRRAFWGCVIGGLPTFTSAVAAAAAAGDAGKVIVTATRTSQPVDDALSSVTIITRADIEARQATSVQELLTGEAGVQISNNGGLGKATDVFLRGTDADHILVLVDGVKLGSATLGTTAFEYLPIGEIDRIEIVRGPRSSLYGSEAVGGVIQIFTHRGHGDPQLTASIGGGSHGTEIVSAGLSGNSGNLTYSVSQSYLGSDGYVSCRGTPVPPGGGCFTFDPTPDGFHNASQAVRVGYDFGDATSAEVTVLRAQGGTRFAGTFVNHESFVQQAVGLTGRWSPLPAVHLMARAGQARDEATDDLNRVPQSTFDTVHNQGTLQADWQLATQQLLTLGADAQRDGVASSVAYAVGARRDVGEFLEYQGAVADEGWSISGRHDYNEQFGGQTTGNAAWAHRFSTALRMTASLGTAFRAPTFNELYYPFFGNPALRPEHSRSMELGLDDSGVQARWSLHAFETRVHDLIAFDSSFLPANIDEAVIRGVEGEMTARRPASTASLTLTWLDPRNRTPGSAEAGNLLPRRAKMSGRLELEHRWVRVRLMGRFNAAGRRFDDFANTRPLGGYTTIDLVGGWSLTSQWSLQAKLANVTDRHYETAEFYPQDGRNAWISLRYQPGPPNQERDSR
jgi:vitamin B12 transporter